MIAGLAAFGGLVLQHDVLAAGILVAGFDSALGHFHEFADAVGVVHHEIPRLQRQRIDAVAAARSSSLSARDVAHAVARNVGFRDHHKVWAAEHEAGVGQRLVEGDRPVHGLEARRGHARGDAVFPQAIRHAVDRALRRRHERRLAVVLPDVQLQRGVELLDRLGVTLRCGRAFELQGQRRRVVCSEHAGRGKGPPGVARLPRRDFERLVGAVRRRGDV